MTYDRFAVEFDRNQGKKTTTIATGSHERATVQFRDKIYYVTPINFTVSARSPLDTPQGEFEFCINSVRSNNQKFDSICRDAIKNVIFNPPATIVFWADGTKTVVKTQEGDDFDPEKGLAMAISKKALGNQGNYYNQFKKWTGEYEKKQKVNPMTLEEFCNWWENLAKHFSL